MDTIYQTQQAFRAVFNELREYCLETIIELQAILVKRNENIFNLIKANAEKLNSAIIQKIQNMASIQKKTDIYQTILNYVEHVLHSFEECPKFIQSPNILESLLWILTRFKNSDYLKKIEAVVENLYDFETLSSLEKFKNVNIDAVEQLFVLKFSKVFLREYVFKLYTIYSPQQTEIANRLVENLPNQDDRQDPEEDLEEDDIKEETFSVNDVSSEDETKEKKEKAQGVDQTWRNLRPSRIKRVNKDNLKLYKKIVSTLKSSGSSYTDADFPPETTSITPDISQIPPNRKIVWKRIPEVYNNKKLTLCSDKIGPHDVLQGKLKNCYFLSALSVLAEHKEFIYRLFESKEISPVGCYSVWLCDSGEWKNIIIDDYIPCLIRKKGQLKPYFSRIKGDDIWVLLLEKAYAKLYGHYFSLQSGYQAEAFYALTGGSVDRFNPKQIRVQSIEQLWAFLTKSIEQKFVITVSCRDDEPTLNNKGMGLVSHHAYGVLDAKEVQVSEGKIEKIVKLRNPWGYREWKGKWGDKSPVWTQEFVKALNYKPHNKDGVFWMSLEDVDKHFYQVYACQIHSDYNYSFLKLGEKGNQNIFLAKMMLKSPGHVYVNVQQKAKRHFRNTTGYEYSFARVFIAKMKKDKIFSIIQGKFKSFQNISIDKHFTKGKYLIFIQMEWAQDLYHKVNLTTSSNVKVNLIEEPLDKYDIPSLYQELIRKYMSLRNSKRFKTTQYELEGQKTQVWKHEFKKFGLGVILYSNQEKNTEFISYLDIQNSLSKELISPVGEVSPLTVYVPSGEERMLIFKTYKGINTGRDYSFHYNEIYEFKKVSVQNELVDVVQEKESLINNDEEAKVDSPQGETMEKLKEDALKAPEEEKGFLADSENKDSVEEDRVNKKLFISEEKQIITNF